MRIQRLALVCFAAVVAASGLVFADPPPAPTQPRPVPAAEPPRPIYRFDVTIRRPDDAPNAHPPTYTINVQEHDGAAFSIGTNIPLGVSTAGVVSPRQDVGLEMHLSFEVHGNIVVVRGHVEMSAAETSAGSAATIHRVRAEGSVPLTPGHPALFASLADMTTRRPYEITISATRVF